MYTPGYIHAYKTGLLKKNTQKALELLKSCNLCPRDCKINRFNNKKGYCQTGRYARIASYSPHFGEERPLVGRHGSGTIFFSSCNLLCSFCQNYEISHYNEGIEITSSSVRCGHFSAARRRKLGVRFTDRDGLSLSYYR